MDMTLIDFLDEFVKNSLDIKEAEKDSTIEKIHLGELKSQVDREYLFSYNMRILSELSRYEIRKGER